MQTLIKWTRGVQSSVGNLSFQSRYGTSPCPSGIFATSDGVGANQANQDYEHPFILAAGASLTTSLVGANGELDTLNRLLGFTIVKGVELVLTSPDPASGISLLLGPQGVANAAQLFWGGVTTSFADSVADMFASFNRGAGWAISGGNNLLPIKNPSAVSVSGWLRVIGVNPSL